MHSRQGQFPPLILAGRPVILVMARLPELGRAKSRLAHSIGEQAALRLHTAFLRDSLVLAGSAALYLGGTSALAYTGDGHPADHGLSEFASFTQRGGDLGQRQVEAQERMFSRGAGAVITIGSDSPTLPADRIHAAWHERHQADLLVVPATDGGYVLVSQTRPLPDLYRQVPWGTARVMEALAARVRAAGLTLRRLQPWHDVDDLDALRGLQQELSLAPEAAPHSALVLKTMALPTAGGGAWQQ